MKNKIMHLYLKYARMCIIATVLFLCVSCLSLLMPGLKIELIIWVNNAGSNASISLFS